MSIQTACEKLRREAKGDLLTEAIAEHLAANMTEELAALVERPEYIAAEMGRFVIGMAKKQLHSQDGGLPEEVVYGYATDYYHANREEIKKTIADSRKWFLPVEPPTKVITPQKPAKTETKPPKTVAKKPETVTKPADPVIKPPKKAKPVDEGQLSLFDLMGGLGNA